MDSDTQNPEGNSCNVVLPSALEKACLITEASWEKLKLYLNYPEKKRMAVIIEMYDKNPPENSRLEPPIKSVLEGLDFKVEMFTQEEQTEKKFKEFIQEIKTKIKESKEGTECFILVLTGMSAEKGKTNEFKTRDEEGLWGNSLSLWTDVMEEFNNAKCKELIEVPKIFILQLYRSPVGSDSGGVPHAKPDLRPPHLPTWTDILLCNSKMVGCYPFQNPSKGHSSTKDSPKGDSLQKDLLNGSHFMEFLCKVLKHRGRGTDICTVLDIVSEMLKVQMEHQRRRGESENEFSQYYNIGFKKEYWFPK